MNMSEKLELGVIDALFRINREYERTHGNIYLSFSGGKDSTVLAHIIKSANLPSLIPFVFANTGIELDATLDFVKKFDYNNIVIVKPRKPAVKVWKEYGKPIKSKLKSEALSTYQKNIEDPLNTARARQMIIGIREKGGEHIGGTNSYALSEKDFHLLHPDLEYNVANKCCQYMKKYPFSDFAKEYNMEGAFTGVRVAEGGARSMAYKSCVEIKKLHGKDFLMSMPLIDWSDEMMDEYIEFFQIELSEAYNTYGLERTGCIACPFSRDIRSELKALYDYEPNKYKASIKMMGDVYMDSGVECEWDEEYMQNFRERQKINEERRKEMKDKFQEQLDYRKEFNKQDRLNRKKK